MKLFDTNNNILVDKYLDIPKGKAFSKKSIYKNDIASIDASVIIPCYNSQEYLPKCLDSLMVQGNKYNYEIIAVNDGSSDQTGEILKKYAKKNNRIKIIEQENKGFSGARNAGIQESKGRYLLFVDSDDYVSENYIECLLDGAFSSNADIVNCGYYTFRDKKIIKRVSIHGNSDKTSINGCFWAKAFRRELLGNVCFPEGYWYEDSILAHLIYPQTKTYYSVEKCEYAYRSNPKGITITSKGKIKALDSFYITQLMIDSVREMYGKEYFLSKEYYEIIVEQFYLNQKRILQLNKEIQKEVFEKQSRFLIENYTNYFTENRLYIYYEKALKEELFNRSIFYLKLDKVYKVLNIIGNRKRNEG